MGVDTGVGGGEQSEIKTGREEEKTKVSTLQEGL